MTHASAQPRLIFFSEPGGARLGAALAAPGALDALAACGAGVALALDALDGRAAAAARLLAARGVPLVAWLCVPSDDGVALNTANYPRAAVRYQELRAWAAAEGLRFEAVGLAIEPPADPGDWSLWRALRNLAHGLWLASDNALFPAAQRAYQELIAAMRHDGYAVHAYQLPLLSDDRRAGTTLLQRALDIVELPADLEVLMCASDVPIDWLGGDLGGALIARYGHSADAIAVGAVDMGAPPAATLPWAALRRDLLLAAQHTDTIYVASLEHCALGGLLPQIAALGWQAPARPRPGRAALVGLTRAGLLTVLLVGRYGRTALAWAGWALALLLWLRGRRR